MLPDNFQPRTLDGFKRLARQLKRELGVPLMKALEIAAQRLGYPHYYAAKRAFDEAVEQRGRELT